MEQNEKIIQDQKVEIEKLNRIITSYKKNDNRFSKLKYLAYSSFSTLLFGKGLLKSMREFIIDIPKKVNKEALSDVLTHTIWRFSRIGMLAILIALAPIIILGIQTKLLLTQNKQFSYQNILFESQLKQMDKQNEIIDLQTKILLSQNVKLDTQNMLSSIQTDLFKKQILQSDFQNSLFSNQNILLQNQNAKIEQQIVLTEAERRSSLIFLMSNILDKLDEELKNSAGREISDELSARIIALSNAFEPYHFFDNGKITSKPLSPERGQLLVALLSSNINEDIFIEKISTKANFSYSNLKNVKLHSKNLDGFNLEYSDFENADFQGSSLQMTNLRNCNISNAIFRNCDFSGANLLNSTLDSTDLRESNFEGAFIKNISAENIICYSDCFEKAVSH